MVNPDSFSGVIIEEMLHEDQTDAFTPSVDSFLLTGDRVTGLACYVRFF